MYIATAWKILYKKNKLLELTLSMHNVVHTWAGFSTTVLPAAKRGEIFHANIIRG